jgi:NAD(P)-dependent dehydrogenase (short-subunit alcohol dehydrogenase family)
MESNQQNPFGLSGKKILITGASSGLGRQCAVQCSKSGADVIISGRNRSRLEDTISLMASGDHDLIEDDLEDYFSYEKIVNSTISIHGKIDGFIHSAGVELTLPVTSMKPKHYEKLFKINVISGFEIAKFLIKKKAIGTNGASFVFIASIMGTMGQIGKIGYCSSKGAVVSGVKALALELASQKIRVNSILPAVCKTKMSEELFSNLTEVAQNHLLDMHPLGLGDPNDVAFAAIYLLSDASKWITGTSLTVDGGYSAQ